jgi:hypothetical protein
MTRHAHAVTRHRLASHHAVTSLAVSMAHAIATKPLEAIRCRKRHGTGCLGEHGRFAVWCRADRVANPAERRLDGFGVGRRFMAGELVCVADGGAAASNG